MFEDFLTNLNNTFLQFASQKSVFSIDQIIQLSKTSKNPFQQYNPSKRHKRGHAFRMLNGSSTRYCYKFSLIWPSYCRPIELRKIDAILNFLTHEIQNTFSKVIFDNFYTSFKLSKNSHQKSHFAKNSQTLCMIGPSFKLTLAVTQQFEVTCNVWKLGPIMFFWSRSRMIPPSSTTWYSR